jgi:hypothetical protein
MTYRGLALALAVAACGAIGPSATFPVGTLKVVVNRTLTPVLTGVGIVGPCSELVLDQAALDDWAAEVESTRGPSLPPDTVDLSNVAGEVPGRTGPLIWVITAGDSNHFSTGLDRASLPACAGKATPAVYRG